MPWRRKHPDAPHGEDYGPHEVAHALEVAAFPATRDDLIRSLGAKAVQVGRGHAVDLKSVLERMPGDRYASLEDAEAAAERAWKDIRNLPPYTGYPGEEAWAGSIGEPEGREHVEESRAGLEGDQRRLT